MKGTLTPLLSIVVAVLLFFFYAQPEYDKILVIKENINKHEEAVLRYTEFNNEVRTLLAKRDAISMSDKERLELLIPTQIDTTRLLVDLEKIAKDSGVLYGNIKAEEEKNAKALTDEDIYNSKNIDSTSLVSSDISFSIIGNYEQFKSFLAKLESSLPLFEVTEISLTAGTETFQQFDVSIRAFAIPEPPQI